ncbi:MAG: CinA family nicotinamide mononucleotide deamidase-related protein [Pseudomonadota bacterium]|nr:CinA family nicotinamide mononucleotide deamidase-related protein [Pseudomonadota bacterium]
MHCEIIAVGTELLLGQNVDTNSAWMGEQLALAGIDSHYHTHVGDNLARMVSALSIALERSDAVIMCGGLGPTHDDITREAIARTMDVPLVRDVSLVERIRERFTSRGREMPLNNLRQADVPQGAALIPQMPGTAPGLICLAGDKVIYAVPGVPTEMRDMVAGTVIPDLQKRAGNAAVIVSRTLRTWGQSESELGELISARITALNASGNPTLAFLASGIEGIKVRITAKARDHATAKSLLDEEDNRLRAILGELVFGVDEETMESVIIDLLRAHKLTLGLAETITGGLLSARLTAVPSAEDVVRGGLVLSAKGIRAGLPNVPALPSDPGQAAQALARFACRFFASDIGLAAAGALDEDAPSHAVFLAIAHGELTKSKVVRLPGRSAQVRQFTVINLLNLVRLELKAAAAS